MAIKETFRESNMYVMTHPSFALLIEQNLHFVAGAKKDLLSFSIH